jgi:filamentous hemagglutinin family protein
MFTETRQLFHWHRTFHKGREFARCRRFVAGIMIFGAAAVADAAPTGGTVVPGSGDATIAPGTDTLITQTTDRVDIDWDSFDTVVGESVTFDQLAGDHSVAINRVLDGNRTFFDGMLNANGRVFLINRNGITFGSTAQINVGSLLATTSDTDRIEQDEVLIGQQAVNGVVVYQFTGNGEYASVINEGNITVSDGGFAVLAAPNVQNHGYIKADLGQIELASTQDYDLRVDFRGDGLIFFSPSDLPEQFEGELEADETLGVTNTGTLQARSGHVYLTANMTGPVYLSTDTASEIVEGVVNLDGIVDADQFVADNNGDVAMVASPGGTIKVTSTGDINIGGGADIHAVGGERVTGLFRAADDITMGAEGDAAKITLKATSESDGYSANDANAEAQLEMIAAGGSLDIAGGEIEVTAVAVADNSMNDNGDYYPEVYRVGGNRNARAVATAFMTGEHTDINADITVTADARASSPDFIDNVNGVASGTCFQCDSHGPDAAEAIAALDVFAVGEAGSDYPEGNLTMEGDINVSANAWAEDSRSTMATANTILAATGDLDVEGNIDVTAVATSEAPTIPDREPFSTASDYECLDIYCGGPAPESADANAALLMLGGAPVGLLEPLYYLSFNVPENLGTLSDILTLTNAYDLLNMFDGLDDLGLDIGRIGHGDVNYKGDINVISHAQYNTIGDIFRRQAGLAQATSAAYIAGGGDTYIDTDPIVVDSLAEADYRDLYVYDSVEPNVVLNTDDNYVDAEARSFLVMVAGLGDLADGVSATQLNGDNGHYEDHGSDLTILGDVSATATDLETYTSNSEIPRNGLQAELYREDTQLTGALTALLATGDITVRGADPLAQAGPLGDADHTALAQGRTSRWQVCELGYGCSPVEEGIDGLEGFIYAPDDIYLAQLIIEAGGDIDIQSKTKTQPNGLFKDPIGPDWPGNLPLRFDANGQMLVATGADATRPPRMVALDSNVQAAILAGGDPSKLLPATASGGCVAAGLDAFTVSEGDYFDRLISASCKGAK